MRCSFVCNILPGLVNGSPADSTGLAQWVAELNSGGGMRAVVTNGFVTSAPFDPRVRKRIYANSCTLGFCARQGKATSRDSSYS
jgi:hypothetical protein